MISSLHNVYSETSLKQIQIYYKMDTLHADTIKVIKGQHTTISLDAQVFTYIYSFSCQQAAPFHQGIHTLLLMACTDTDDCNLHCYAGRDLSLKQQHNFVITAQPLPLRSFSGIMMQLNNVTTPTDKLTT